MSEYYQLKNLFLNNQLNIQNVFSLIEQAGVDGISADDINNFDSLSAKEIPFAEYLKENLSNIDISGDGKISQEELNKMFSQMKGQGVTYEQLYAMLCSSSGTNRSLLEYALRNFQAMDSNHDGKLSQTEINLSKVKTEIAQRNFAKYQEELSKISGESTLEEHLKNTGYFG